MLFLKSRKTNKIQKIMIVIIIIKEAGWWGFSHPGKSFRLLVGLPSNGHSLSP